MNVLSIYRRHTPQCPYRDQGRNWTRCSCPLWADGKLNGKRYRRSLGTRDWRRAVRRLAQLEADLAATEPGGLDKPLDEAITAFLAYSRDLAPGTQRNYSRALRYLKDAAKNRGLESVSELDAETIDRLRASRDINTLTWTKELQILRHFFRFCEARKWTKENPARLVEMPRNVKPAPREPYTQNEIIRILAACDQIGRTSYERLRARAIVLLLRYTGLRVSDVATLTRDRVRNGEIHLYTAKNGKPVRLPVPPELQTALDGLPVPRGAPGASRYFFWSGNGSTRSAIRDVTRTLATVFRASGVKDAHAHRFRHTLATEILEIGGTIDDAADILGNSPAIIRKHYAKWSTRRQERISGLLERVFFGTNLVQGQNEPVSDSFQRGLVGGRHGTRTHDPGVANAVLSQLS